MKKRHYLFVSLLFIASIIFTDHVALAVDNDADADYEYIDDEEYTGELDGSADEFEEDLRSLDDLDGEMLSEEYADRPDDCTQYEKYDAEEQTCYYECETDAECDAIEDKIDDELAK